MPPSGTATVTVFSERKVEVETISLVVRDADGQRRQLPLGLEPVVVGTSPDADLTLQSPGVSRRHCQLSLVAGGVRIEDLDSKNGTWTAGLAIRSAVVPVATVLTVGQAELRLERTGPPTIHALAPRPRFGAALGSSIAMRRLFAQLERVAVTEETILLRGESGTGKELLARGVHEASRLAEGPYVVLDCAALAPTVIEAELFGHERGAFTGAHEARDGLLARASGGTLFIDEIGELPLDLQPRLLRVLETGELRRLGGTQSRRVDLRVVSATHRDLSQMVREGTFREDLFYRLAVLVVRVPPLRERVEDIPLLAGRFLANLKPPRSLASLPPSTLTMLERHRWPGNVRELRNVVTRLAVLGPDADTVMAPSAPTIAPPTAPALLHLPLREARETVVDAFEASYITAQLEAHGDNVSKTAEAIGISRQMLHRLITRHDIRR